MFADSFPGRPVPAKRNIQDLVKKWRATGSVGNATKNRQPLIRTPALVADIQQILAVSPSKSTRKLAQQARISRTTCRRVLKDLRMKPHRVKGARKLKESDKTKQRKMQKKAHSNMFCNGEFTSFISYPSLHRNSDRQMGWAVFFFS